MSGGSLAERLGFADDVRVVVAHADDVGLCPSTIAAFAELTAAGTVTSGSLMAVSPWFPAAAAWARRHPEADLGVHLALTSEHPAFRWPALSTRDPASGLVDDDGYLPATVERATRADPGAVRREISAQLDRATAAGIDLTHADSHVYAAFAPGLLSAFVDECLARGVVPVLWRPSAEPWFRIDPAAAARWAEGWERRGVPLLDGVARVRLTGEPGEAGDGALEAVLATFDSLPPGVSHLLLHPAVDSPELRALTPSWRRRVADYQAFRDPRLPALLADRGIRLIGYRPLAERLRRRSARPAEAAAARG